MRSEFVAAHALRPLIFLGHFLHYLLRRFGAHGCAQTAAALTFATLIALVPALVLMLGILGSLPHFGGYADAFRKFAFANLVPDAAGRVTAIYMEQFVRHAGGLTLVGTVLLAVSVLALLLMLERALNAVWQVPRPRPLWQRIARSSALIVLGPLLIGVSLSFGTRLIPLMLGKVYFFSASEKVLLHSVPVMLNALLLALVYRYTPKAYIPWRHVFSSAMLIAIALDAMKMGFGWYVRHVLTYRMIYGTFASLPIFLLWLHLCWIVVLFGAVLTAAWSHRDRLSGTPLPTPWQRMALAQRVLDALAPMATEEPHHGRRTTSVVALQQTTQAGYDELAHVLDELSALGWVHVTRHGVVAPSRALTPTQEGLAARFLGRPQAP